MQLSRLRFVFVVFFTFIGLLAIAPFTVRPPSFVESAKGTSLGSDATPSSLLKLAAPSKHAFVTFLEEFSGANKAEDADDLDEEDAYFTATRVLGYQLMHDPRSRSPNSTPFVVICSEVSERKRKRLEKDGATVVEVEKISNPYWVKTRQQYEGVMTKLRVFEQEQYEKILYIDADMLIVRPLDDIFSDPGTLITGSLGNRSSVPDEHSLPASYMLAAQAQQRSRNHPYPPTAKADWFCAGFFVFSPSKMIFEHYMSIMNSKNRFDPLYPDQNLLNYAHRWDGPMPWTKFNYTWTTTYPTIKEYNLGAASLHEKYWLEQYRAKEYGQNILGEMWLKTKADMTDFYGKRDADEE